jgi:hypothetical protein
MVNVEHVTDRQALGALDLDAIVFQRLASAARSGTRVLDWAVDTRTPVFLDIDDDFQSLAQGSEHEQSAEAGELWPILQEQLPTFDSIWCSTEPLIRRVAPFARATRQRPTLPPAWAFDPVPARRRGGGVRIIYFGTPTHVDDWMWIREEILDVAVEFGMRVTLAGIPDSQSHFAVDCVSAPDGVGVNYSTYWSWLRALGQFDIGLAPLKPSLVNQAKSGLKPLEYLSLGALPIVGDCPAYRALIADGVGIPLVTSGRTSWAHSLRSVGAMTVQERITAIANARKSARDLVFMLEKTTLDKDVQDLRGALR